MSNLFAALDRFGALRFVGDVPRGAACGCVCPVCTSPLIAKQGEEKIWHFAHEAGQERPECRAGAVNMLRRLALESLIGRETWHLPHLSKPVVCMSGFKSISETVHLDDSLSRPWEWAAPGANGDAIASSVLSSGSAVQLFIAVDGEPFSPETQPTAAAIALLVPMPPLQVLRTRQSAEHHLQKSANLFWLQHPGLEALAAKRRAELDALVRAQAEEYNRQQSKIAGQRWARIAKGSGSHDEPVTIERPQSQAPAPAPHRDAGSDLVDTRWPWAPGKKLGTGFNYYGLRDGTKWVFYRRVDGTFGLVQLGGLDEGWDEAWPPAVGLPDASLGIYIVKDWQNAFAQLARYARETANGDNPDEFLRR